jgi:hypothetical protein
VTEGARRREGVTTWKHTFGVHPAAPTTRQAITGQDRPMVAITRAITSMGSCSPTASDRSPPNAPRSTPFPPGSTRARLSAGVNQTTRGQLSRAPTPSWTSCSSRSARPAPSSRSASNAGPPCSTGSTALRRKNQTGRQRALAPLLDRVDKETSRAPRSRLTVDRKEVWRR